MRTIKNSLIVISLIFSLNTFSLAKVYKHIEPLLITKSRNNFPNPFRMVKNLFRRIFRLNHIIIETTSYVDSLDLSNPEVIASCLDEKESCSRPESRTYVLTKAFDPENDLLTYNYTIKAGKIIGTGPGVVWDLSGVPPGEYKITAAVDDGCGFCGKTMTKTVKVIECKDCK